MPASVSAVPGGRPPGTFYPYDFDDTVRTVVQTAGNNDASVLPIIYNPDKQNGSEYELNFDTASAGSLVWTLKEVSTSRLVFENVSDLTGGSLYRVIENGFDLVVKSPLVGVTAVLDEDSVNVFGVLVSTPDSSLTSLSGTSPFTGEDYEIRFGEQSYATQRKDLGFARGAIRVPFAVYERGRGKSNAILRKVAVGVYDTSVTTGVWEVSQGLNTFEPVFVTSLDYPEDDPNTAVHEDSSTLASSDLRDWIISIMGFNRNDSVSALNEIRVIDRDGNGLPPSSGRIRFNKYHEIRSGDSRLIDLEAVIRNDPGLGKQDVAAITVFPNPFYGTNADATATTGEYVTFSHLPSKAVVRIFNLAGLFVRKLEKSDPSSQFLRWDLRNEHGKAVGSGIYLVTMELQDGAGNNLGTTVVKLAVINGTN